MTKHQSNMMLKNFSHSMLVSVDLFNRISFLAWQCIFKCLINTISFHLMLSLIFTINIKSEGHTYTINRINNNITTNSLKRQKKRSMKSLQYRSVKQHINHWNGIDSKMTVDSSKCNTTTAHTQSKI